MEPKKIHENGVVELYEEDERAGSVLCLTCYRRWDDTVSSSVTPAPSGRCPFEYEHEDEPDDELDGRCTRMLRDGRCELDAGHRGRHSTVAFYCDGHAGMVRGYPHAQDEDVAFCWFCCKVTGPAEDRERELASDESYRYAARGGRPGEEMAR